MGREHKIHKDDGKYNPLCKEKSWWCLDEEWENVECKKCLNLKSKEEKNK